MSEIESKVKSIIVDKLGVDEAEVKNEASFANDLGADSLDTVELIMEFEKEFQIQIPDDQAEPRLVKPLPKHGRTSSSEKAEPGRLLILTRPSSRHSSLAK